MSYLNPADFVDDEPVETDPTKITALVLCTDPEVWAAEFLKASPMNDAQVAAWFGAAMETKRMMAIASLPLPRFR